MADGTSDGIACARSAAWRAAGVLRTQYAWCLWLFCRGLGALGGVASIDHPRGDAVALDRRSNPGQWVLADAHSPRARYLARLYRRRSEEHTSELQSLMRISYAVFCLKKKHKYHISHRPYLY